MSQLDSLDSLVADVLGDAVLGTYLRVAGEREQHVARVVIEIGEQPERLPEAHRPVLRRALEAYHGPDDGRFDDLAAQVHPCADALRAAIAGAMLRRNEAVV